MLNKPKQSMHAKLNKLETQYLVDEETQSGTSEGDDVTSENSWLFPQWMKNADVCSGCDLAFGLTVRQHHCRRCRSIFCQQCSSRTSQILLFSITDSVRVCDRCFKDLLSENQYFEITVPMLQAGQQFKIPAFMGLSSKIVTLRLMADRSTLVFDDDSRSEPYVIRLVDIENVSPVSLKAFEISTEVKARRFESDNQSVQINWVDALKAAAIRSRKPPLKAQIETERRRKEECRRREEYAQERKQRDDAEKSRKREQRDKIKGKWSIL